jgi:hypothetical protein
MAIKVSTGQALAPIAQTTHRKALTSHQIAEICHRPALQEPIKNNNSVLDVLNIGFDPTGIVSCLGSTGGINQQVTIKIHEQSFQVPTEFREGFTLAGNVLPALPLFRLNRPDGQTQTFLILNRTLYELGPDGKLSSVNPSNFKVLDLHGQELSTARPQQSLPTELQLPGTPSSTDPRPPSESSPIPNLNPDPVKQDIESLLRNLITTKIVDEKTNPFLSENASRIPRPGVSKLVVRNSQGLTLLNVTRDTPDGEMPTVYFDSQRLNLKQALPKPGCTTIVTGSRNQSNEINLLKPTDRNSGTFCLPTTTSGLTTIQQIGFAAPLPAYTSPGL